MKYLLAMALAFLLPMAALAQSGPSYSDNCKAWLGLVDAGQYAESWDTAGTLVQTTFTKEQWVGMVKAVRDAVGQPLSRSAAQVVPADTLPNLPFGRYLVITIHTKFSLAPSATETIIMKLENSQWKVVGYFIK